jgi:hypothetical protein
MSRLRLNKVADPAAPAANKVELFYDSAGPGTGTPIVLSAINESGVLAILGHFAVQSYRLLGVRFITATPFVPSAGCRMLFVECQAGGGAGGGVATAVTNSGAAGGGGGGAYSASWLAPTSASITCGVGAGGTAGAAGANPGNAGGDTTWDTNVIVAKGGAGGLADTVATIHAGGLGGAGGLAASGTGTMKGGGSAGVAGVALAAAQAVSGAGGASAFGGGGAARKTQAAGIAGDPYGGGGSGGCILSGGASVAGGAGGIGFIRVWEWG